MVSPPTSSKPERAPSPSAARGFATRVGSSARAAVDRLDARLRVVEDAAWSVVTQLRGVFAFAAFVVSVALVLASPLLRVARVEIEGLRRVHAAELRHLAGVSNGALLTAIDDRDVVDRVSAHPWVESVEVERVWPSTLVIRVTEHSPVAMVRREGALWYVDAGGVPFLRARLDDADYPVIAGLPEELAALDARAGRLVIRDALALLDALSETTFAAEVEASEVVFSVERGFELRLVSVTDGRPGARVVVGYVRPGEARARLARLADVVANGVRLTSPVLVDVGGDRVALVRADLPLATVPMPPGLAAPSPSGVTPSGEGRALPPAPGVTVPPTVLPAPAAPVPSPASAAPSAG